MRVSVRTRKRAPPEVLFSFSSEGGAKFGRLTAEHLPIGDFKYKLAIVLDDVLETAPNLMSEIRDSGRITGNFTQKEVDEIVRIVNAGSLPAALDPTPVHDTTIPRRSQRPGSGCRHSVEIVLADQERRAAAGSDEGSVACENAP